MKPRWTAVYSSMKHLLRDESGQDLIEYAAVAALIGLAAILSLHGLSNKIDNAFNSIGGGLTNAV
jgi:pilus assembly protein Flp/PilA